MDTKSNTRSTLLAYAKHFAATLVLLAISLAIGCDRRPYRPPPFDNVQVLRASGFDECNIAASFGPITVCDSLILKPLDSLGPTGWTATSSFDRNVKIWCIDTEAYKHVGDEGASDWRRWISQLELHGNSIGFSDWSERIPSVLGASTIWIYISSEQVGHYFVNSDGKGVCTILSTETPVGIEVVLEGVKRNEHDIAAEITFRSIRISQAQN